MISKKDEETATNLVRLLVSDEELEEKNETVLFFQLPFGDGYGTKTFTKSFINNAVDSSNFLIKLYCSGGKLIVIQQKCSSSTMLMNGDTWEKATDIWGIVEEFNTKVAMS